MPRYSNGKTSEFIIVQGQIKNDLSCFGITKKLVRQQFGKEKKTRKRKNSFVLNQTQGSILYLPKSCSIYIERQK